MDVKDSTNITGISRLINYDGDRNLEDLEKGIIDDINDTVEITDVEQYKQQLEELGNALGVSLDDDDDGKDRSRKKKKKTTRRFYWNKLICS
jgi:hypothetical protein